VDDFMQLLFGGIVVLLGIVILSFPKRVANLTTIMLGSGHEHIKTYLKSDKYILNAKISSLAFFSVGLIVILGTIMQR